MATFPSPQSYLKTVGGLELDPPTYTTPSAGDYVIGGYHDLDGVDERIEFGDLAALDFDHATDTFSVSHWVYSESSATGQLVFGNVYGASASNQGAGWGIARTPSGIAFFRYNQSSAAYVQTTISGNTWTHYLWVFTAGGTITVYKDGVLQSTSSGGSFTPPFDYTNAEVMIGSLVTNTAHFNGRVAEVAVWNSDQSANIAAIYNSRARHNLMDLATPPDVFYAPLTSYGDDPGSGGSVAEVVANNDGTGVSMETADAVIPTPTTVTSTLTKALDVATSVVTTTKVEDVITGTTGGTGSSFP